MLTIVHNGISLDINPDTIIILEHATEEEYNRLANEDLKLDFDGERLYIHSPASARHEMLVLDVLITCKNYFEAHPDLGVPLGSHFSVRLPNGKRTEPDTVVIPPDRFHPESSVFEGVPLLVLEVLSPSNRAHDINIKRIWYEENQVPEIWFIDPDEKSLTIFSLMLNGLYKEERIVSGVLPSKTFKGLTFSIHDLFEKEKK